MRVLCVAEKNSIAKAVAAILGGGRSKASDSTYKYVKNYSFTYDGFPFAPHGCDVIMTSVAGHLSGVDFDAAQYGWGKSDPFTLFDAPLIETMDTNQKQIAANIRKEARNADVLMIWTDCDREGEYIGWEIHQVAKKGNSYLQDDKVYRAIFSHIEGSHIIHAARNPERIDQKSVDAVSTRIELDLRTGVSFTRLLTNTLAPRIQAISAPRLSNRDYLNANNINNNRKKDKIVVSYGPCQFPTLGFVVDRFERIRNFVPEEFWYIQLQIDSEDGLKKLSTTFQWERGHIFDRHSVLTLYEMCLELGGDEAKVCDLKSKPSTKYRPFPLTTVELQKNCARYLRLNAKQSLAAAEKLYQKGFISYPRTETDTFPSKMNLQDLVQKQAQREQDRDDRNVWAQYAANLLDGNYPNNFTFPRSGKHDDKAHPPIHPIIPLGKNAQIDETERRVYEYVVRHFLACCSEDAKGQTSTLTLDWVGEKFTATGLVVLEKNWLDVYPWAKWETTKQLPRLEMNEICTLSKAEMKSGMTSTPKPMTESELIVLMDANGIGTDATIADHIEKIQTRNYVQSEKVGKETFLQPTKLGVALVHGFEEIGLEDSFAKPFQRREMEEDLKKICEGQTNKSAVVADIIQKYRGYYMRTNQSKNVLVDVYNRVNRTMS
ncbi:DNA topoisomerase 3 [Monosporozyma unispora]|nr:DNA topoisomerase [Kazachstania unispora]